MCTKRTVDGMYAISRNGMEPARNIPQDVKTRNDRFYNWNQGVHHEIKQCARDSR